MNGVINIVKEMWIAMTRTPSAEELAMRELDDAKRQHLQMLTALDYSKRMVDYHQDRIKRLTAYIAKGVSNDD
jgi:predicted outer membrane protein